MEPDRRKLIQTGSVVVATLVLGARLKRARAQDKAPAKGAGLRLSEKDPQAQALGYVEDASRVDRKKHANYQPGQFCHNCAQYDGKPDAPTAPCKIFQGKAVVGKGWCAAWAKKA